jgi:hypothetical protein
VRRPAVRQWPFSDGDISFERGLLLRVRGGSASWVFRYTAASGKRREMGLGVVSLAAEELFDSQLAAARELTAKARAVLSAGGDPIDSRAAEKQSARVVRLHAKALTVKRALRLWYDVNEKRWSKRYASQVAFRIENDPPSWLLSIPLDELRFSDVVKALGEMTVSQDRIDSMRQRLDWMMEMNMAHGRLTANPAGVRRIVRGRFKSMETA